MQRDQDSINPRTHSDAMFLKSNPESDHPYLYGRVIGIFHADAMDRKSMTQFERVEFLFVCWYQVLDAANNKAPVLSSIPSFR